VEHSLDMTVVLGPDGDPLYASPAVTAVLGWASGNFESGAPGARPLRSFDLVHPEDVERVEKMFFRGLDEHGHEERLEFRMRRVDGTYRWVEAVTTNRLDDTAVGGIVVNARDVTERRDAEEAVRASERDLRTLLEGSPDLIARFDRQLRHVYVNPAVTAATGIPRAEMVGRTMRELGAPEHILEIWDTNLRRAFETGACNDFEYPFRTPYGKCWFQTRMAPEYGADGTIETMLVVIRDVTDRKLVEDALTHQALHDPLTGLPNRLLLLDRVAQALRRLERHGGLMAVLFLDLDRFKVVNDSLGHAAGDWLLVEVGKRLRSASRPDDTVARLGGDEFIVLCEDAGDDQDAAGVADRLASALAQPFRYDGRPLSITASIGIATSADPSIDAAALVDDADAAMYRAKERGRARYEFFDAAMRGQAVARLDLELDLRGALERGEFRLLYQPFVCLRGERAVAVEALVRWEHPTHGVLDPSDFISLAEETGLIVPLGTWILREACRCLAKWTATGHHPQPPTMAVNLSPRQLAQPDLVEVVGRVLDQTGVDARNLCLEITETAVLHDTPSAESALQALRDLGVRIALDDFGTGYSSLGYLRRLPVDVLKIDRSFVQRIGRDNTDLAIVAAVTALAHALGLTIVAEGIERADQFDAMDRLGVDQVQGFYCAPTVDADELLRMPIGAHDLRREAALAVRK
jgi:diguanylate cyclase (GGDEF)-like protein/PAS domain S-box-containing protein